MLQLCLTCKITCEYKARHTSDALRAHKGCSLISLFPSKDIRLDRLSGVFTDSQSQACPV